ncbi:MAG: glycosyltransferase [Clostridium sp.]|uniref:glycosyltransferase n=1 Tax=Clostridium sp. TaxID=1506 RepID=UPI00305720B1
MNISIICPLYNGESFLEELHYSLINQENVEISSIDYRMTEGKDKTEEILQKLNCNYRKIKSKEFSHSITREEAAFEATGDILVFITQDIIIKDNRWLYNLVKPIEEGSCVASFSRQICDNDTLEKYTRENNYPKESKIKSKADIKELGIKTFFFSDASSAIRRDIFLNVNGYDQKKLLTNEDMYIAHKLIMAGHKIRYSAESWVIHSHKFTLKQLYKRYYDTGVFLGEHNYLLDYKANKAATGLLGYVVRRAIEERNYKALVRVIPNFGARYLGNFFGKKKGERLGRNGGMQ